MASYDDCSFLAVCHCLFEFVYVVLLFLLTWRINALSLSFSIRLRSHLPVVNNIISAMLCVNAIFAVESCPSVRPSACHDPVLYQNDLSYRRNSFTT